MPYCYVSSLLRSKIAFHLITITLRHQQRIVSNTFLFLIQTTLFLFQTSVANKRNIKILDLNFPFLHFNGIIQQQIEFFILKDLFLKSLLLLDYPHLSLKFLAQRVAFDPNLSPNLQQVDCFLKEPCALITCFNIFFYCLIRSKRCCFSVCKLLMGLAVSYKLDQLNTTCICLIRL